MQVDVNIRNDEGSNLGTAPNTVLETDVFAKYGAEADAEIARIIAENAGSNGSAHAASPSVSSAAPRAAAKPARS
jgi:membrane fusion protein (multidrug efflux system)